MQSHSKRPAITCLNKIFFSFLLFMALLSHAQSDLPGKAPCAREGFQQVHPRGIPFLIRTNVCRDESNAGVVQIEVLSSAEKILQSLSSSFNSPSYVLSLDVVLDLDGDGKPDLAVNTGKGKDGDGMHYWLYDAAGMTYIDLGESPALAHDDSAARNELFSIVSSSGEMQSIRFDYQIKSNKLIKIRAIGFIPVNDSDEYCLVEFAKHADGDFYPSKSRITVSGEVAEECMSGKGLCPGHQ